MPATLAQPAITEVSVAPARWGLDAEICAKSLDWMLVVPKGRVSDLASIPRLAWWLIAPFELSITAVFVHDELYEHGGLMRASQVGYPSERCLQRFTRAEADEFLYDLAAADGVWWWRRWLAYKAVRWFGARYWKAA